MVNVTIYSVPSITKFRFYGNVTKLQDKKAALILRKKPLLGTLLRLVRHGFFAVRWRGAAAAWHLQQSAKR